MGLTTDPNDPGLRNICSDGQQEVYMILSDEERAKGFVRPVRKTYVHVKCGVATTMGSKLAETYARDPTFYGGTFCVGCQKHFPLIEPNIDHQGRPLLGGAKPQFLWDDGTAVGS